jgi:hypothetical protein
LDIDNEMLDNRGDFRSQCQEHILGFLRQAFDLQFVVQDNDTEPPVATRYGGGVNASLVLESCFCRWGDGVGTTASTACNRFAPT